MTDNRRVSEPQPRVRDRDVVVVAALVVAGVVIFAWLTGLIPALDDAVGLAPVIIVGMLVVTGFVLLRTARSRS
jgi:hypothetical protein